MKFGRMPSDENKDNNSDINDGEHGAVSKRRGDITETMITRGTRQKWHRVKNEPWARFLERLTNLDLENKKIVHMDLHLPFCTNLKVLHLYDNKIKKISGLEHALQLTHLHLQNNEIEEMSGLEKLHRLTKLFLNGNKISFVGGLENCRRLQELHLSDQRLERGVELGFDPASIDGICESLMVLDISRSNIHTLRGLGQLMMLRVLKAAGNEVTDFEDVGEVIASAYEIFELDLKSNPVSEMRGFRDALILNTEYLHEINGTPIKPNQREFLRRRAQHRASRSGKSKSKSEAQGMGGFKKGYEATAPRFVNAMPAGKVLRKDRKPSYSRFSGQARRNMSSKSQNPSSMNFGGLSISGNGM